MRLRPGRNLLRASGVLILAGLLCFVWSGFASLVVAGAVLLAVMTLLELGPLRRAIADVALRRGVPAKVARGIPFHVGIVIANQGQEGVRGTIRDIVPAGAQPRTWRASVEVAGVGATIPGNEERAFTTQLHSYEIVLPVRGMHQFGSVWLLLTGPRRLLELLREYPIGQSVQALPEAIAPGHELEKNVLSEMGLLDKSARARLHGPGMEFDSLVDYGQGDDPRHIDWRSSARHCRLIVRRYRIEQHRDVLLVVDCGRMMGGQAGAGTKLDQAINAALVLGKVALKQGDRCGIGVFDNEVRAYLPPVSGTSSFHLLAEHLADVQSHWRESDFGCMFATVQLRQPKRCTCIVFSDLMDTDTSERFRSGLMRLGMRNSVIFVAIRTPLLREVASAEIGEASDVARKAVAFRLIRDREAVLHSLDRSGVHVLDVEPRDITVPLINKYIALRQRSVM